MLQILSNNTRRTKVVELSTGTHRVPDELRKHYLSDGEGGQYSTNLDRNRYGNDDQYLFTGGLTLELQAGGCMHLSCIQGMHRRLHRMDWGMHRRNQFRLGGIGQCECVLATQ
jgi:hypothetical protein